MAGALEGYDELWLDVTRCGDEVKAKAWCDERIGVDGSGLMEQVPDLAPADEAFLADPVLADAFTTSIAEAFRQGTGGFTQDLTIEGRAWGFDTGLIDVPVRVVHGEDDTLAPRAHAQHTSDVIPDAVLEILPGHGHGHISTIREFPRLCQQLAAALR